MAKTRGIFTDCPPLVNFPSRNAERSRLTTLALAFQISSRHATSASGSLPSVMSTSLSSLSAWMLWIPKMSLCLVSSVEKKPEGFEFQGIAEHLRQVALGGSRRTEEKDVGFCRQAQEEGPDGMVQFDEVRLKIVFEFIESLHIFSSFGCLTSPYNWSGA